MRDRSVAGRSIVTRRAIVDIVRTAVQSSYGVTGFADPSFGLRVLRWLRLASPGIRLETTGGLTLDLDLVVAHGVPVAEVARQVDSAVRYALRRGLGVEVACLSIHVDGLRYQPAVPARTGTPQPSDEPAGSTAPAEHAGTAEHGGSEAAEGSRSASADGSAGSNGTSRPATNGTAPAVTSGEPRTAPGDRTTR